MKTVFALSILSVALFCGFIVTGQSGYRVGDKVQDFHLQNVDGKTVSLADYTQAKGFIVTFTCNHCPFAKMYEQRIIDLNKEFAPKGYPVIAISPNDGDAIVEDSPENMKVRAVQMHYSFPYLYDATQVTSHAFGVTNTPHVFVVQKTASGDIVKYIGAIDNNAQDASAATKHYVADAVNSLLAGKPIAITQTKAIGCSIKWRN